jgi:hypothetical protein
MGYQSLSLLKTCSVIVTSLDSVTSPCLQGLVLIHPTLQVLVYKDSFLSTPLYESLIYQDSFLSTHLCSKNLVDWFSDSFFFTVPRQKHSSLWAKILKIFFKIDLMEVHHISKNYVCIYLSSLPIKEIKDRIW